MRNPILTPRRIGKMTNLGFKTLGRYASACSYRVPTGRKAPRMEKSNADNCNSDKEKPILDIIYTALHPLLIGTYSQQVCWGDCFPYVGQGEQERTQGVCDVSHHCGVFHQGLRRIYNEVCPSAALALDYLSVPADASPFALTLILALEQSPAFSLAAEGT